MKDMRTVIGRSLSNISRICDNHEGIKYPSANEVKQKIKYARISSNEAWRIGFINYVENLMKTCSVANAELSYEALVILELVR